MLDSIGVLIVVSVLAGLVRGYAGFGFAAIAIVGFNLFLSPQQSIPVVLGLDVLCSVSLWKQARRDANTQVFKMLTFGALSGLPIGLLLLFFIPETLLKLSICIVITLFSLVLIFDVKIRNTSSRWVQFAFGLSSGAGTAGASVGGPMIACYMLSSQLDSNVQRATMILFFIVSETIALILLLLSGVVGKEELVWLSLLFVPTLIAVRMGQVLFNVAPPKSLKHFALPVMMLVAILGISASLNAMY